MVKLVSGSLRQGAAMAVLLVVLMSCGSDDSPTAAGVGDEASSEATTSTVADNDADASEDEHDDDGDDHHGDDEHKDDDEHDDESSSGLGAHEHGVAELAVAWTEDEVVIDLISPTHNIFGFEYEPETDEEQEVVADRLDALSQPGVMAFNEEAGCEPTDEVETELEFEGSHAELTASWLFTCDAPEEIQQLDVAALFAEFPNLQDIDAQWASPSGQSAAELSPTSTVLSLE